jgi:hypothetical protein
LPSLQTSGVPATQTPSTLQASAPLHTLPSEHDVPAGAMLHRPGVPADRVGGLHVRQVPQLALSQHTPSTQKPVSHCWLEQALPVGQVQAPPRVWYSQVSESSMVAPASLDPSATTVRPRAESNAEPA